MKSSVYRQVNGQKPEIKVLCENIGQALMVIREMARRYYNNTDAIFNVKGNIVWRINCSKPEKVANLRTDRVFYLDNFKLYVERSYE